MAQALPGGRPVSMSPPPPAPAPTQDDEPKVDPIAAAEEYALIYPVRAALIRRLGRVPDSARFGPPEAWLAGALVTGRTPVLLALDRQHTRRSGRVACHAVASGDRSWTARARPVPFGETLEVRRGREGKTPRPSAFPRAKYRAMAATQATPHRWQVTACRNDVRGLVCDIVLPRRSAVAAHTA